MSGIFDRLRGKGRLSDSDVDHALGDVRLALLEADVHLQVTDRLLDRIRQRAVGTEVRRSLTPAQQVVKIVNEELVVTLGGEPARLAIPDSPPAVILMVGLQGSGKTTTAAKLAGFLAHEGRSPLLVAADLARPAASEQLVVLGGRIGVPVYTEQGSRPARVARAAVRAARSGGNDVVVIDTAGRIQIDAGLMAELAGLAKAVGPDDILLVVDAMTGQDAVNVAGGFADAIALTGLVLTKLDGDARGGAAISVREVTGTPIMFSGVGESLGDLESFHPDRMASRILGMGDVMTLIEKAESTWDAADAEKVAGKLRTASFTFDDFLLQFQQLRKMGPLQQVVGMLPGASGVLRDAEVSEQDLARVEAIIRSMTPAERDNPKTINGSRRRRIAAGSGTAPQDVNRLLRQFAQVQKMMKDFAAGEQGMLGSLLGGGRRKKKR